MDKKGVIGLKTIEMVFLGFMIVAIIGVAIVLSTSSLIDVEERLNRQSNTVLGEDGGYINETGYDLDDSSATGFTNPSITSAFNTTSGAVIQSGNWTLLTNGTVLNATSQTWGNVTFNYTYQIISGDARAISGNTSGGLVDFFENTSTILSILAVVVIILAIAIIIFVIKRFSGGSPGGKL